jgi:hypothetical protein
MIDSIVSARDLGNTRQKKLILRDIMLDEAPGNVVGVIGKNRNRKNHLAGDSSAGRRQPRVLGVIRTGQL